jgi:hypothetical protein
MRARMKVAPRSSRSPLAVRRTVRRSSLRVTAFTRAPSSPSWPSRCCMRAFSADCSTRRRSITLLTFFPKYSAREVARASGAR